ncbi:MAG TPA: NUDIX hydrolase [Candidatus Pacebacteria bacterium]|nr:NUDIX hydrolase [Candidatus Paceibacterota bacterium]
MIKCQFENGGQANLRHVVVDTIVLNSDQTQVLLVKRVAKLLEGGKWALVGGYVERDETLAEAVRREVKEETGYEIDTPTLIKINDSPHRPHEDRQNVSFVFVCHVKTKTGSADWESSAQQWFNLTDLPALETIAFDHGQNLKFWLASQQKT